MDAFIAHIEGIFASHGDRLFANLPSGPLTYAACLGEMNAYAALISGLAVQTGDRALIVSSHDQATIVLFFTLLRSGITPVIADRAATLAESLELVAVCRTNIVFCDENHPLCGASSGLDPDLAVVRLGADGTAISAKLIAPPMSAKHAEGTAPARTPPADGNQIAVLVLTSGTTSAPKAVALTYENLRAQLDIFRQVYGFDAETRLLNVLPLHHVDGLIRGPLAALWFGGSLHRPRPFSVQAAPDLLAAVSALGITHFITVPAMLRIIERVGRDHPKAFSTASFRFVLSSADLLDPALWRRVEETFGVRVVNAYGLSEVVCDALFAGPGDDTHKIGTLGKPVGCTARILDGAGNQVGDGETGELVLSGPTVMSGYFGAPEATARVLYDGAFHTGDYVRTDKHGNFEFVGRKKTAIVSAGFTIHPETATQVLSAMPGVHEAFAFGVPDANNGQRLVAAVVAAPGHTVTAEDAAAYCRSLLSPERSPREFRVVPSLPRGASGKVLLADLAKMMAEMPDVRGTVDVLSVAAACFNVSVDKVSFASTPFNTDGWDSLAHMTLIETLEAAFDIQFSAMQIAQIMSLGDAHQFIGEHLALADGPRK